MNRVATVTETEATYGPDGLVGYSPRGHKELDTTEVT